MSYIDPTENIHKAPPQLCALLHSSQLQDCWSFLPFISKGIQCSEGEFGLRHKVSCSLPNLFLIVANNIEEQRIAGEDGFCDFVTWFWFVTYTSVLLIFNFFLFFLKKNYLTNNILP